MSIIEGGVSSKRGFTVQSLINKTSDYQRNVTLA